MKAKTSKPGSVTMQQVILESEKEVESFVSIETDPMLRAILCGRIDLSISNISDSIEKNFLEGSVIKGSDGSPDPLQSTITANEATRFVESVRRALEETKAIYMSQRDRKNDPAKEGERSTSDYDYSMDARIWFDMPDVTPTEAAMVLCRLNPLEREDPERIYVDGDKSSPDRYRRLLWIFETEARTSPKHRTLMKWLTIARVRDLRYHSWIDEYVQLTGRDNETEVGAVINQGEGKAPVVIWTEEKCEQLRQEHAALTMKGHKSPTKELANKYSMSGARIRELKAGKKAAQVKKRPSRF